MVAHLHPASRESLRAATDRLDDVIDTSSVTDLERLGAELFSVLRLLEHQPRLRRHLGDASAPAEARTLLVDRLLMDKVGRLTLDVMSDLAAARWSQPGDLLEALETLARRATLGVAERNGSLEEVEDQLFRIGRILNREQELSRLLGDRSTADDRRAELLRGLLAGRTSPVTLALMEQSVRSPRGAGLDLTTEELCELAAARRDRYVAHVRTPIRLTVEQEWRLTESLSRLYGRPISLQIELDEELLGGLVIRIGGEVIDGSVASKLGVARRNLPH
ncbi:F0F1 ATP synthase subunit delta [Pseudonocardia hispaniensis]|uniref:ATP synthase subunit delta n=1 Tax=Pseudonocardia hispaniensis TaxID=904933 RepID=A0ABW1IXM3_9PSEU